MRTANRNPAILNLDSHVFREAADEVLAHRTRRGSYSCATSFGNLDHYTRRADPMRQPVPLRVLRRNHQGGDSAMAKTPHPNSGRLLSRRDALTVGIGWIIRRNFHRRVSLPRSLNPDTFRICAACFRRSVRNSILSTTRAKPQWAGSYSEPRIARHGFPSPGFVSECVGSF